MDVSIESDRRASLQQCNNSLARHTKPNNSHIHTPQTILNHSEITPPLNNSSNFDLPVLMFPKNNLILPTHTAITSITFVNLSN